MIHNDESPLTDTEVHWLRSEHVGEEFKIVVGDCGARSSPGAVLFMGDAWANFGTAVEIIRLLRLTEVVPPMLVVAVGYRASFEETLALRSRDFTPTVALTPSYTDATMMGGADRFLAFLRDELKPWVGERYGVDPDDSMLFGDSLGGLFATHVLLSEPTAFRRYGIGSPSLWWDDWLMLRRAADRAKTHDDLPAKVFVSVGAFETLAGDQRFLDQLPADQRAKAEAEEAAADSPPVNMVADADRMVATLRAARFPNLELEYEVLQGEYHETAPPLNLSRSLRRLFDAPH